MPKATLCGLIIRRLSIIDSCLHFGAAIPEKESGVCVQLILSNDGRTSSEILSSHVS